MSETHHHLTLVHLYIETATLEELKQLKSHLEDWIEKLEKRQAEGQLER